MPRSNFQLPLLFGEPLLTHASKGGPPREAWFWLSPLWGHCPLPLGLGACKIFFVPSKTGVSVCLGPSKGLKSNPAGPQSQSPWGFPGLLSDPQPGKPGVGFRTFTTVGELLWYYCPTVWGSCTQWVWDFLLLWFSPSYHLAAPFFFVFGLGVSFFAGFQHPLVHGCSTASYYFGVLTGGDEHMSFYYGILN